MTDRELIQKAARAAGKTIGSFADGGVAEQYGACAAWDGLDWWNPRDDDGDSMRLAVRLQINVNHNHPAQTPLWVGAGAANYSGWIETFENESQRADATRLAVLQAAAEMADAAGAA